MVGGLIFSNFEQRYIYSIEQLHLCFIWLKESLALTCLLPVSLTFSGVEQTELRRSRPHSVTQLQGYSEH